MYPGLADGSVELQKLARPDCLTPKEKADVLIAAHKIVVGESDEGRSPSHS
jgi:hypothetical protein